MELDYLLDEIMPDVQCVIASMQAELVDISLKKTGNGLLLSLLVDTERGITVDECADINRRISAELEAKDIILQRYVVEVSSPGLDRLLKTERDFKKAIGQRVEIQLLEFIENKKSVRGILMSADSEGVEIQEKGNKVLSLPYEIIDKAKRIF
jgi:ribosome maturation factor RimP